MGISIDAKLLYGAPYEELSELENLKEMLDDGDLESASPYYDSDKDDWVIGVALPLQMAVDGEMQETIRKAQVEFERLTGGLPGKIIASAHVI